MCKRINILVVEDEPLILDVFINALNTVDEKNDAFQFRIKSVSNSDKALREIYCAVKARPFDLLLLDISMPPSKDETILCGEDIGIEIKNLFPNVKIIAFASNNNNYRLNSILKSLDPDGLLVKNELKYTELLNAINTVLHEPPYYSKIVQKLIRRHMCHEFTLDSIDRQILYYTLKGAKIKEIADFVNLSKSAVEHRKSNLRTTFDVEGGTDRDLILKAESAGFI